MLAAVVVVVCSSAPVFWLGEADEDNVQRRTECVSEMTLESTQLLIRNQFRMHILSLSPTADTYLGGHLIHQTTSAVA